MKIGPTENARKLQQEFLRKTHAEERKGKKSMEQIKGRSLVAPTSVPNDQTQRNGAVDPAKEAGLTKNEFYKNDTWIVGKKNDRKCYVAQKNTVPKYLEKAFTPQKREDLVPGNLAYDRSKFVLDEWSYSDFPGGRVAIALRNHSKLIPDHVIASITFQENTFVISIPSLPESGVFPFNENEFLKAIDAAKWDLELFAMPQSDSDSDAESQKGPS